MSEEIHKPAPDDATSVEKVIPSKQKKGRYSLKEMMAEVVIERRDSVFGRELVDSTEIEKMFSKQRVKKKKK